MPEQQPDVCVVLTHKEAQTLVAMRNPCRLRTEAWLFAASARAKIAAALDAAKGGDRA